MKLTHSFTIARPIDQVYAAFLDVERIATCMPGSRLTGTDADGNHTGEVRIKVGPLGVAYAGTFRILEADAQAHRLVMRARGREASGAGNADARIIAALTESGGGTDISVETDLDIRGKVAQFGRGVIGEVTEEILGTFVRNVEAMLAGPGSGAAVTAPPAAPRAVAATGTPAATTPTAPRADEPAEVPGLDAWSLIVRPMLARHVTELLTVAAAGIAAYLGARLGSRRH